jgi:hypothetical protein
MAVPHRLPLRIFLLAYNPDKGSVGLGTNLSAMLRAAADYAALIVSVGIDAGEAIRIIQAALTTAGLPTPATP